MTYATSTARNLLDSADEATGLRRLDLLKGAAFAVETATCELVAELKADGASWGQVGDALGITRQAAQQRYRKHL